MQRTFGPINSPVNNPGQSNTDVAGLAKREGILEERERQIAEKQKLIDEKTELVGDMGVDIINTVRKYKSEQQFSMKEGFARLVLGNDDLEFHEMIKSMEADLKAVLNVKEIVFAGQTSLESEKFGIKIGLVKI